MEVREIHKRKINKGDPIKRDEAIKKMRKEHEKLIKGMFEFVDAQGGFLDFSYRYFPDEPILQFHINHGEICELPMGVVKHLNNCVKKIRIMAPNGEKPTRGVPNTVTKQSRVRFTPMDMM